MKGRILSALAGAQGGKRFAVTPQTFTLAPSGAMTVTKFGLSASRSP